MQLVAKSSVGVDYLVDPGLPNRILIEYKTRNYFEEAGIPLSVSGFSSFLLGKTESYSPINLVWDMTSRCNLNCGFCYIRDNNRHESYTKQLVITVIDELVERGLFQVYLSGGECLLATDFIQIYRYLKLKGLFVTVFTNSYLINDGILATWKELPPSSVEVTLYDMNPIPLDNIRILRERGINVVPKFTLTTTTKPYYDSVQSWSKANGFNLFVDCEIFDGQDAQHSNLEDSFSLSPSDKLLYTPQRYELTTREHSKRKGFSCKASMGGVHISPDFTLSICNRMRERWDLHDHTVPQAIEGIRRVVETYRDAQLIGCQGCSFSKYCDMCYAHAVKADHELYVPEGFCERVNSKYRILCGQHTA